MPWKQILLFTALRLLDSASGLPAIRQFMWMPLEDFSYRKLSTTGFNQVMDLSCDFHDSKDSGRLFQTVCRGQSVKDIISKICFSICPMIVDLALAVGILYYVFGPYMALIVASVAVMFVWTSGKIINQQREKQREWLKTRMREYTALCESTSNWRTVSYFNHIGYEKTKYRSAVEDQLKSRLSLKFWGQLESTSQSVLLTLGLMVACFMAAYEVAAGHKPIGTFIMLLSYWAQLSGPLQLIASGLGSIALDIVEVEDFLDLLRQKPTVTDAVDAKPLVSGDGEIEFSNVDFSYDGKRQVLRDINFRASPGQTTALVGQTGGGKSTILKLISRFYDPSAGSVKINGQDVSQITLGSLRESLGIVPQDPSLFHDTLMNNIRYARLDASDDEIIEACKAVALHEKILSFSDGYDTLVGERGNKLSGGELQRVAIARAIIRNPKIVLLDEATSSVDSETEAHVQESLKSLTAGRTTLVIAYVSHICAWSFVLSRTPILPYHVPVFCPPSRPAQVPNPHSCRLAPQY
jgi:ABC-type transport system involved in Fe-S cluster assembly fused permease/ATPase subunit